jgi:hypothetical protein
MQTGLRLLKDNAVLTKVNGPTPYYEISMTSAEAAGPEERCTMQIAATKPLRDPITTIHVHPDYKELRPEDWIVVKHMNGGDCGCPEWAKKAQSVYDVWQKIHLTLRHKKHNDRAAFAFYPQFEYETAEALGHASLVAGLALATLIPECYWPLVEKYGSERLKTLIEDYDVGRDRAFDSDVDEGEEFDDEYEGEGPIYNQDSDDEILGIGW